jgi:hypothetical protein
MGTTSTPEYLPLDIRTPWMNVIRSLQSHARSQSGLAILNITILVNQDGIPVGWTTPRRTCFEPKANADQLLEILRGMIEGTPI